MAEEKKRVLLIGKQPDIELFAVLGREGYDVAVFESLDTARGVRLLYRPHVIIVYRRYPKDVTVLDECVAMAGRVPVVAALSLLAKRALTDAAREKAASVVVLPVKPQTIREALRSLELPKDEALLALAGQKVCEPVSQESSA